MIIWIVLGLASLVPVLGVGFLAWWLWRRKGYGRILAVLAVAIPGLWMAYLLRPREPHMFTFAELDRAKADAVVLMRKAEATEVGDLPIALGERELPESMRLGTLIAYIYPDHVSLVQFSCPDYLYGIRIWKDGASIPADEKPTDCPRVTRFFVDKDVPGGGDESPIRFRTER